MTVAEALCAICRVGTVKARKGNLRVLIPKTAAMDLQPALDTLQAGKTEAVSLLADPDLAQLEHASGVLMRAGMRIMELDGITTIGVWSDLDGPELRAALHSFGSGELPVRYLDGAGIPDRYKLRQVEGEPVPMLVLAEMEPHSAEPWKVRDRMLNAGRGGFECR